MEKMLKIKQAILILLIAFSILLIISFVLSNILQIIFLILAVICAISGLLIYLLLWNCPHCQRHLGRIELSNRCKHCGKEIYYK
ncbi:MAG: hypothetical protein RSE07_04305 [Oscillospiraceae bacterium]